MKEDQNEKDVKHKRHNSECMKSTLKSSIF
jgi:hypothetical protein